MHWVEKVSVRRKIYIQAFFIYYLSGKRPDQEYDIVFGPVADDNVYATLQLYELGILDKE